MRKTRTAEKPVPEEKEMQSENHFDYSKAKPNRFAAHIKQRSRVVVIDPDVAEVFANQESVNAVPRALIETMPSKASSPISKGRNKG